MYAILGPVAITFLCQHTASAPLVARVPHDLPVQHSGRLEHEVRRLLVVDPVINFEPRLVEPVGDHSLSSSKVRAPQTKAAMAKGNLILYRVKLNLAKKVLRISSSKLSHLKEISTAYQQLLFF